MGSLGEDIAAWFLARQGLRIVDRNVVLRHGEIDLVAIDGRTRVMVEVRTRTGGGDPIDAVDDVKRNGLGWLGAGGGVGRVDLVGVLVGYRQVDIHWVPDAV